MSPVATLGGSWFWDGTSYVWYPDYEGDSPTGDPPDPGSNEPQIIEWTGGTWMIDAQPMEFTGGITYSDFVPDADGDGLPDDLDPYPYEPSNNSQWFEGGTWVIHGAYQSWEGAWYASFEPLPDNDGDDLPDDWDPYPQDGNNYSFWFAGGTFTRHDLTLALRAGYHAGTGADDNQDGFPDELDDIFLNPSSYGTLQFWAGGTFLINGAYNTYPAAHYFAPTVSDQDGDGIPDELDAAPDDAWNGTWFHWAGGTYPVDGVVTVFPPRVYGGLFADTDGDTLPDAADPYPADPANNSEWWSGGSFPVDGVIQEFAGQWHRANAGDGDGDGIPEDVDPYPVDPNNPTIPQFTWQGGVFRIDGVEQTFQAGEYPGAWADADADGLPDSLDPHPSDPANNSAWWTGGTFSIDGQSQVLSARWHRANAGDADGDSIPEDIDPYPGDALNPTPVSYTWAGGVFRINGIEQTLAGGTFAGLWSDGDGDQIPDPADPFPADAANNSLWWLGGTWLVEGVNQDFQACWVAANAPDQDGDGIPDALDPHPQDSWNGTGWWWPETASITVKIQNQNITFARQHYLTAWSDVDGDGLPDIADPLPQDLYNGNDSDGDGLPDSQEALYAGVLDAEDPADAQVVRADGVSYLRAHLYNGQAVAAGRADLVLPLTSLISLERDSDQDRVGDRYEVAYGLNPFDNLDAVSGSQEDRVLIAEKAAAGLDPWSEVLPEEYANITGQDPAGVYHDAEMSYAENDWDADGVSNMDEWLLFQTSLRDPGQRPDDSQILTAMVEGRVSQTTWLNYYHLLNSNPGGDCTCGGPGCPVSGCACDSYCEVWSPHYCGCGGISCYIYDCFCTETCGGGGAGGGSGGVGSGGTGPCDCVNTAPGSNVACTCSETDPTCDPNTLCGSPQTGEKCSAACPSSPESCTCSAPCAEDPSMPSGCGLGDTSCSCQREGCTASPPDPNDEYSEGTPCNCAQPTCNPVATDCVCGCDPQVGGCAPSANPAVDHATCIAGTQPDLPDGQVYTGVHPCSAHVAIEFDVKHTEIDPATGQVVSPGVNTMLRDEIVDIRIKVPPIGTTDWTVDLSVEPQAMRNQDLPNRGNVQMYDFGQIEGDGTVTSDKTQFVLKASSGGERTIRAVFNKEGNLKIKMKSTDGKIEFTSPDYTIQKRMRKYASLPSSQNHDLNQHDEAFEDAANHWGGVYQHQVDDVERLKAMGMAESELGLTDATDILTVGNNDDFVIPRLKGLTSGVRLNGATATWTKEFEFLPNSGGYEPSYYDYQDASKATSAIAIKWGVCWFYKKGMISALDSNNPPTYAKFDGWRTWESTTTRYNGGGVDNYLERVNRAMKEGRHPSNANLYIWPLKSNKMARGNQ